MHGVRAKVTTLQLRSRGAISGTLTHPRSQNLSRSATAAPTHTIAWPQYGNSSRARSVKQPNKGRCTHHVWCHADTTSGRWPAEWQQHWHRSAPGGDPALQGVQPGVLGTPIRPLVTTHQRSGAPTGRPLCGAVLCTDTRQFKTSTRPATPTHPQYVGCFFNSLHTAIIAANHHNGRRCSAPAPDQRSTEAAQWHDHQHACAPANQYHCNSVNVPVSTCQYHCTVPERQRSTGAEGAHAAWANIMLMMRSHGRPSIHIGPLVAGPTTRGLLQECKSSHAARIKVKLPSEGAPRRGTRSQKGAMYVRQRDWSQIVMLKARCCGTVVPTRCC
jgi:hypothetical protein